MSGNFDRQLGTIAGQWQAALDRREQARAALYTASGQPKYVQAAHNEALADLDASLQQSSAVCLEQLDSMLSSIDDELLKGDLDPLLQLNSAFKAEIPGKAPYIRENCESLLLPELSRQLDANTLHGTTVDKMLYARYAKLRLQDERRKLSTAGDVTAPNGMEAFINALDRLSATLPTVDTSQLKDERVKVSRLIARINAERYRTLEPAMQEMIGRF